MNSQEEFVVNETITQLHDCWRTEVNSPEILPIRLELVDEITEILQNQQVIIIIIIRYYYYNYYW